ncbi:hypothetical protein AAMO2058_001053400 [Amorphochlora amoebiformis]
MTHYEVLGVEITADTEEIRKAYKKAALRCHPDKNHGLSTKVDQFERVVRAWETLRDEKLREEYNRQLKIDEDIPIAYEIAASELKIRVVTDSNEDTVITEESVQSASKSTPGEGVTFYAYPCRCGYEFEVFIEDILDGFDTFGCPGCSLNLRVSCLNHLLTPQNLDSRNSEPTKKPIKVKQLAESTETDPESKT